VNADSSPQLIFALFPLIFGAIFFFAIWSGVRRRDRIREILSEWERENGYTILGQSGVWFSLDPFVLFAGKSRTVYRITVRDRSGDVREALIRVRTRDWYYQDSYEVKWLD
jgi:hypothetical protein